MTFAEGGGLVDDVSSFFAPASSDLVDSLVGEYRQMRDRVEAMHAAVTGEAVAGALFHFIEGNLRDQRTGTVGTIDRLFNLEGAVAHLNAFYWDKALRMTDVLDVMPQKRRDEWFEQIRNPLGKKRDKYDSEYLVLPIPEFGGEAVRTTLADLLLSRSKFFAERVDGIFRALSREHVTNRPEGFSKRMIIPRAISSYGTVEYSTAGVINDLRCIIAKFMGRDEPGFDATTAVIQKVRKDNGTWASIDGGALRMRIYNGVGTAHLDVHPEMAWRLNAVLANLHPGAIPSQFREKPRRKVKEFQLMERPLPFAVIGLLNRMKPMYKPIEGAGYRDVKFKDVKNTLRFDHGDTDKHAAAEAIMVLESIGGVRCLERNVTFWQFDYDPTDVLAEIICNGCIPDHKSHQFYPTPASLAQMAVELAEISPDHTCLEPSAGIGGLADFIPERRHLTCVEISEIHATVLRAKGYYVVRGDFIKAAELATGARFDRIIMNPPFDQGRWRAHLEHAAGMLADNGRLVAILPVGARSTQGLLPGFHLSWRGKFDNQFVGASVSVVILVAERE